MDTLLVTGRSRADFGAGQGYHTVRNWGFQMIQEIMLVYETMKHCKQKGICCSNLKGHNIPPKLTKTKTMISVVSQCLGCTCKVAMWMGRDENLCIGIGVSQLLSSSFPLPHPGLTDPYIGVQETKPEHQKRSQYSTQSHYGLQMFTESFIC